ncbi:MAG: sigma-70 family RNA polymerase sigma factor [Candidatus Bathyarchaeota archaeon]|nr:sigma-70 family RNA polymerase sigma factor [Candidatus Bathyarchaeota archaeon]
MKLPKNMTEEQFLGAFNSVVKKIAHKYTFTSYEIEDIEQEAFLIAVRALEDYDNSRSLENFLYVHLSNRLKNFKRDNYYRYEVGDAQKIQNTKKNILEPIDIHELFHVAAGSSIFEEAHIAEMLSIIDESLPANMRADYLKLKNKGKLTKASRNKVIKKIQEILNGEE